jgi:hypothetical protein
MEAMRSTAHRRIPTGPRAHLRALGASCVFALVTGCAGMMRTDTFKGSCGPEHDRCVAACKEFKDWEKADTCVSACQSESRRCELRQRPAADDGLGTDLTQRKAVTDVGPPKTQLVDFSPGRIESSGVSVNAQGAVRQAGDVFELMPGGSLTIGFTAPPDAREAELEIEHGAGGGGAPCFVTITLAEKTLLGRYSAPRRSLDGVLKNEQFNLTPNLPPPARSTDDTTPRPMTLVVYNNAELKSESPYFIRRIRFTTRELAR